MDLQNPQPGVLYVPDGFEQHLRGARTGELSTNQAHGTWNEPLRSGGMFTISTPQAGITVTANMLVSVASANAIVGLYNKSSTSYLHVTRLTLTVVSQATACGFVWGFVAPTQLSTVPAGVSRVRIHKTLSIGTSPAAIAFDGSVAVSGSAATDLFRPIVAAMTNVPINAEETDDDIFVPPYGIIGVFGDTVTTATVAKASLTWEEVPL